MSTSLTHVIVLVSVCFAGSTAFADSDPNRAAGKIAADLGISEQAFKTCFEPVLPARNKKPTGVLQHANKAILLPCLQDENSEITNARLDFVMDKYRPEGPNGR